MQFAFWKVYATDDLECSSDDNTEEEDFVKKYMVIPIIFCEQFCLVNVQTCHQDYHKSVDISVFYCICLTLLCAFVGHTNGTSLKI